MTDTAPKTQLGISIIRAGQTIENADLPDGGTADTVAMEDFVCLQIIVPGRENTVGAFMTADEAYNTATALVQAAAKLLSDRIDDNGKKLGLIAALRDLGRNA